MRNSFLGFTVQKLYDKLWQVFKIKGATKGFIEGAACTTTYQVGETSEFPIIVGSNQGSASTPYILAFVINELTRHI